MVAVGRYLASTCALVVVRVIGHELDESWHLELEFGLEMVVEVGLELGRLHLAGPVGLEVVHPVPMLVTVAV